MTVTEKFVFISGANRGIGYQLATQLATKGYRVIAGYRDERRSAALLAQQSENLHPFKVDVTVPEMLDALRTFIENRFGRIDLLINNAGVLLDRAGGMENLAWDSITQHFEVNVGGAFLATKHLYPLLKKGEHPKIINISSRLGSIELGGGSSIPYSISKAALNMLTKSQASAFRAAGVTVVSVHPGWVKTDMGGSAAPLRPEESAAHIIDTIERLSLAQSGQFINYDGSPLPY